MNRKLNPLAMVLALLAASASAWADNYREARAIIERLATAMEELSYQGTFVYVRGKDVMTMRVTHVRDENGTRERMYSMSGPHREIIRDADGVRCVLGDDAESTHDPLVSRSLFPKLPLEELEEARGRYLFKVGGNTRIAGHRAQRLTILARDEFRYGYDLWLEEKTGLLLRWVLYDADRSSLATLMFTDLSYGEDIDLSELQSATPRDAFVRLETKPSAEPAPSPAPAAAHRVGRPDLAGTPPGFRLAAHSPWPDEEDQGLQHFVFSDGLASVSVYIEDSRKAQGLKEGLSRMGTMNAYSRNAGAWQVTAIGEVPAITVKTFSNAFASPMTSAD